jgi:methionyl-tRNA formyltransferase
VPTLHIFGGGTSLLAKAVVLARGLGWSCVVRTSPRLWDDGSADAHEVSSHGCEVIVGESLEATLARGSDIGPADIALSFGAPWIFPETLLDRFGRRAYNYHPRRLPENRGGGGSSWPILMRERTGLAAFHHLTPGIDDGMIVASREFRFSAGARTPLQFDAETEAVAAEVMAEWLPVLLGTGQAPAGNLQADHLSTYWPRLHTATHAWVDWAWNADDIESFVRAFDRPYPGARTWLRGHVVTLRDAEVIERRRFHPFQAGLIYRLDDIGAVVACRDGGILMKVEPTVGPTARIGDRLFTPRWQIDAALGTRVSYAADGTVKPSFAGPLRPSSDA